MNKISSDKALQKFQLLTARQDFMQDIYDLRKKWQIPKNGFLKDTKDWHEWIIKESDKVDSSQEYFKELRKVAQREKQLGKPNSKDTWKQIKEDKKKLI